MRLSVAIIGSGPAGCYAAEGLLRAAPGAAIDVLDRLPTPFGLVRAGVAPDHQGTKAIARVFERILGQAGVSFLGNVEVGRDVTLAELRALYDAVIVATGAPVDRPLDVPGATLPGVFGSAAFAGWYNGHPEWTELAPPLASARSVVIIGNGNVALDMARLLAKTKEERAQADLPPDIADALAASPISAIHVVGRRGPLETKFSPNELRELGALARARPRVMEDAFADGAAPPNDAVGTILAGFAQATPESSPVSLTFHFRARPAAFEGGAAVERAVFERLRRDGDNYVGTGEMLALPADLVITCIGYRSAACCALSPSGDRFANEGGRVEERLYAVGWAARGPSGTIATNRAEGHALAQRLAREVAPADRPGGEKLRRLLEERGVRPFDLAAWKRLDAVERARATPPRPRAKFRRIDEMLAAASQA